MNLKKMIKFCAKEKTPASWWPGGKKEGIMWTNIQTLLMVCFFSFIIITGCKTQSDKAAQNQARSVAKKSIHKLMFVKSQSWRDKIAKELISKGVTTGGDSPGALETEIDTWLKSNPTLKENGSRRRIDSFSFGATMRLTGVTLKSNCQITFTAIVSVDDKNQVASSAAEVLAFLRVKNEKILLN
jgi:hypothetical protein